MRCAKGFVAKGIWGCTGFPFLRWEKGSETPSCNGEKGLRLPRSSCSDLGNEGVSDSFPHRNRQGVSDPFSHRKRGNPVHPQSPLATNPLAQRMKSAPRSACWGTLGGWGLKALLGSSSAKSTLGELFVRKLEKAVAVRNSLLERFSGKCRRC